MNNLTLTLTHSVEGENKELFTKMIEELGEIISDEDIYKSREEKGTLTVKEGELEKIEGIDGDNSLHKKTISFSYEELKDIKNLKDLRRFVIKYKDIIKSKIQEKYPNFSFDEEKEFEKYDSYSDDKETKKNNIKIALDNNELFIKNLLGFLGYSKQEQVKDIAEKEKSEQFARILDKIAENVLAQVGSNGTDENFSELSDKKLKEKLEKIKVSIDNRKENIEERKNIVLKGLEKVGIILGENIGIKEYKNLIKYIDKTDDLNTVLKLYQEDKEKFLEVFRAPFDYIELFFTDEFQDALNVLDHNYKLYNIKKDRFIEFYNSNKDTLFSHLSNVKTNSSPIDLLILVYLVGQTTKDIKTSDDFIKAYEENKRNQKTENLRKKLEGKVDFSLENERLDKLLNNVFNSEDMENFRHNLNVNGLHFVNKIFSKINSDLFLHNIKEDFKEKVLESLANEESIPSVDDFYKEYIEEKDVPEDISEKYKKKLKPILTGIINSIVFAYDEINKKNLS